MSPGKKTVLLAVSLFFFMGVPAFSAERIYTHYPEINGTQADRTDERAPAWGDYRYDGTDCCSPTREQVQRLVADAKRRTNKELYFLRDLERDEFEANKGKIRCMVNNRYGDEESGFSMWTMFFPSDQEYAAEEKRPIVIVGTGLRTSNNKRVFGVRRADLAVMAEKFKCLVVVSNSGGFFSLGTHPNFSNQLEDVIRTLHEKFGGDREKVLFTGGSRGGFVSLFWGANPYGKDYRTIGIFANAAPTEPGTMACTPAANYPGLGRIVEKHIAEGLQKKDRQIEIFRILTGTTDRDAANLVGPMGYLDNYAGVIVSINIGTNDRIVPFSCVQRFMQGLNARSIPCSAKIILGGGHSGDVGIAGYTMRGAANPDVPDDLVDTLTRLRDGLPVRLISSLRYYRSHPSLAKKKVRFLKPVSAPGGTPFFVRVASCLAPGEDWLVEMFGPKGHLWKYELFGPDGKILASYTSSGVFDESERAVHELTPLPDDFCAGACLWKIYLDGRPVEFERVFHGKSGDIPPLLTKVTVESARARERDMKQGILKLGCGAWTADIRPIAFPLCADGIAVADYLSLCVIFVIVLLFTPVLMIIFRKRAPRSGG